MRTTIVLWNFWLSAAGGFAWPQQTGPVTSKREPRQRYLLLATHKPSTLRNELNQALSAGYRVILVPPGPERALLLETAASEQPAPHVVLDESDTADLEGQLNRNGAKGFRLLSRTSAANLAVSVTGGDETLLVMAKTPGSDAPYEYKLLTAESAYWYAPETGKYWGTFKKEGLEYQIEQALKQGYELTALVIRHPGADRKIVAAKGMRIEYIVIVERPLLRRAESSKASVARPRHRLLVASDEKILEEELNRAGKGGYRILAGSPIGRPEMIFLLEDAGVLEGGSQYRVLATNRLTTMQTELNEVAIKGFRAVPHAIVNAGKLVVVTERRPASQTPCQYLVLATSRSSELQREMAQASGQGYEIAGMGRRGQVYIAILRKTAAP